MDYWAGKSWNKNTRKWETKYWKHGTFTATCERNRLMVGLEYKIHNLSFRNTVKISSLNTTQNSIRQNREDSDTSRISRKKAPKSQSRSGAKLCGHKKRYRDEREVKYALRRAQNARLIESDLLGFSRRREVRWYACGTCAGFHLTSQASLLADSLEDQNSAAWQTLTIAVESPSALHDFTFND